MINTVMSSYSDTMTGSELLKWVNELHDWDGGIHNPDMINDIRTNNWELIERYPLKQLGSVEDPYNRVVDPGSLIGSREAAEGRRVTYKNRESVDALNGETEGTETIVGTGQRGTNYQQ